MHRSGDPQDVDERAESRRGADRPRRRGLVARVFSLVKLTLVLTPVALFAASYLVTDCRPRFGGGLGQLLRAGACARGELIAGALSLPDNLGMLRRAID